jgi:hypothetical protein
MYDLYGLVRGNTKPALAGVSVDSLAHQTGSHGLWQYTRAVETLDLDAWRPGLFTGLLNTKISEHKFTINTRSSEQFNGKTRELPACTAGCSASPCMPIGFKRLYGAEDGCDDVKEKINAALPIQDIPWAKFEELGLEGGQAAMRSTFGDRDTRWLPSLWTVHFDATEPVTVTILEIYGTLRFTDGAPRSLTAHYLYVGQSGKLEIGTRSKPFQSPVLLRLEGTRRSPAFHDGASGLKSKFIE